ncbi:hypothetical protein GCM10010331_60710 [Streptomyces xanthochromogenes]|nr:hypothetical protein GCM10010331_60710 [Streptomyces xanthochromogenes]
MGLHRRLRDEQPTPDLRVGAPLRHQPQHRRLPFGQSRPLRPGAGLVDKTPRDRRRQNRLAPRRGPHRLGELTPRQVPEQMARRPRLHGPQRDHFEPGGQLPCRAAHFERGRGLVPGRETAYGVGERTAVQVRGSAPGDQRAGLRKVLAGGGLLEVEMAPGQRNIVGQFRPDGPHRHQHAGEALGNGVVDLP